MDLKFIIDEIQKADPEVYEKISPRRDILKSFGSKVAIAALPIALGSMFKKAYGRTSSVVIDTLNFALELEYLEYNFYHSCNTSTTLMIPGTDQPAFATIEGHELQHVNFLRTAIHNAGGVPYTPNHYSGDPVTGDPYTPLGYDFTAGGMFPVYTSYATFLTVSQTFEDTGVRAYKGQAGNLQSDPDVLTSALQIHSVEGRHASHIRLIRRKAGVADNPKPWITGNIAPASAVQANYNGEDNTTQLTVNITSLPGVSGNVTTVCATEAFDEPLTMAAVLPLIAPFILP
jgi:hypothetical protein